mgnify:CR=1 FL=1
MITESIGELKVLDQELKPLIKTYIKVYGKIDSDNIIFYKDGYTDLNGNFNYTGVGVVTGSKYGKIYVQMFIGK